MKRNKNNQKYIKKKVYINIKEKELDSNILIAQIVKEIFEI